MSIPKCVILLFLPTLAFAEPVKTIYNPFTGKPDYITVMSTSISAGSTNYIQNRSNLQAGATAYPDFLYVNSSAAIMGSGGLRVTYGVTVGTLTTLGGTSISGVSNNTTSILDIFKTNATAGDPIMSIGTNQQIDQLVIRDQFPVTFNVYGVRAGTINVGLSGFNDKIMSANTIDQHINMWNSGNLVVQTGLTADGSKDIIFSPQEIEALRMTSTSGILVTSSMTLSNASGLGVTYGVIVGSITINNGGSSGQTVCWKTATTLGFCSTVVGAGGACTCN